MRALGGRGVRHAVECDLKWAREDGRLLLYLHHGPTGLERLTPAQVRARGVLTVERALERGADLQWLVELKRGHGPEIEAVHAFAERARGARFAIASSTLPILEDLRRALPDLPLALYVSGMTRGGRFLHTPWIALRRGLERGLLLGPDDLRAVDFLVGTDLRLPPARAIERAQRAADRGLVYIPGRVTSVEALEALARAGVRGAFAYCEPDTPGTAG